MHEHPKPPRTGRPAHVRRRPSSDPQRPDASMLLRAYGLGAFPMAVGPRGRIEWFAPDPRGILPLDRFRVPKSLARVVRSGRFEIRVDHDVVEVLRQCAGDRVVRRSVAADGTTVADESPGWMSERLMAAYVELAARGHVHSVEAWRDGLLVGALYGVRLGAAFFGESMFCRPDLGGTDASKVCLVHLVERLRAGGFTLLDTQMVTDHMRRFGAVEICAAEYQRRLEEALGRVGVWVRVR